jgi:hypothetical protein
MGDGRRIPHESGDHQSPPVETRSDVITEGRLRLTDVARSRRCSATFRRWLELPDPTRPKDCRSIAEAAIGTVRGGLVDLCYSTEGPTLSSSGVP